MPANTRDAALRRVYQDARAAGLDDEGARVAAAIAATEHGYEGALGDNGQSAGTFQLYAGGQLPAYAASEGISVEEAKRRLQRDPHAANEWALSTYLGQAIKRGQAQGLHGADLATYAQRTGQVSVSPERAGANYQTIANETGGDVASSRGVDTSGDRPSSEFESPSRFPPTAPAPTRATRMQARISELQQQAQAKQAEIAALQQPGPDEVPTDPNQRLDPRFEAQATQARQNRVAQLEQKSRELSQITTALNGLQTDLANDADPKITDPAVAAKAQTDLARAQVELEQQKLALEAAKTAAAKANSPAAQRIADLEIKRAELGVAQAEVSLENARNPRAPQRAPQTPEEIAQARLNLVKTQQEIDAGAKKMLPQAQQVMQGLSDTITYLQGMYEKGQIELPQMNAYVQMAKDAADAQLRGTTPAEEAATRQTQKNAEKTLGLNILNQRLVSGAGLANTLMSAATGPHVMLRPGQTSLGVDPLEGLKALVDQLGGGAGVSDYGKSLLLGAQGAAPVGPQPAGL